MKNYFLTFVLLTFILALNSSKLKAQYFRGYAQNKYETVLKVNFTNLLIRNFGFQVEKQIGSKKSFLLGLSGSPNGSIPFKNLLMSRFDDSEVLGGVKYNTLELTPEMRFYLSGSEGIRGLYLAPYMRYNIFRGDLFEGVFRVEDENIINEVPILVKASLKGISAGVMLGAQCPIKQKFYLDWWIAGVGIGKGNATILFISELSDVDQVALKENFSNINIPLTKSYFYSNESLGRLEFIGPWVSLRAGLAFGVRF